MKTYLTTITRLISDPLVYRELLSQKTKTSLIHFYISYIIIALIISLYVTVSIIPQVYSLALSNAQSLQDNFPADLIITITKDHLSTSGPNPPITIPLTETIPDSNIESLVIIDPESIAENIVDLNTFFLFTSNAVAFQQNPQSKNTTIFSWSDLELEATITKDNIISETDYFISSINTLKPFTFPLVFLTILVGFTITRLINILIYTFFFSALGSFTKRPYPYRSYFNISLYTITIAEIVSLIQSLVYQSTFANLQTITYFGLTAIIIFSLPKVTKVKIQS